jgi:hypothetical protein
MTRISRREYAAMYGPTTGDRVRLADTELWIEVEADRTSYGDEVKFGGGKVISDGMGQSQRPRAEVVDLVITNALIVDHWGIVKADVGIKDGRIAAIGFIDPSEGDRVIEAAGKVVAPGIVDPHTHYDPQLTFEPYGTSSCYHGVTTVVAGNCGFSIAPTMPERRMQIARTLEKVEDMDVESLAAGIPWDFTTFPEYLASVGAKGSALNFAAYIGHTPLRIYVMGDEASSRTATPEEVEQPPGSPPASPSPTSAPTASRSRAAGRTGPSWRRCSGPRRRAAAVPSASTASTTSCTSTTSTTCSASSASP